MPGYAGNNDVDLIVFQHPVTVQRSTGSLGTTLFIYLQSVRIIGTSCIVPCLRSTTLLQTWLWNRLLFFMVHWCLAVSLNHCGINDVASGFRLLVGSQAHLHRKRKTVLSLIVMLMCGKQAHFPENPSILSIRKNIHVTH